MGSMLPSRSPVFHDILLHIQTQHFRQVDRAKKIIEELEKAAALGKGAAQLDGRMIDAASERMAQNIVNIDNLISKKKG